MPWSITGATQYLAQLGLTDKCRTIKGLDVCNNWDLEPLDLLNGLALGYDQPSPEVLIVHVIYNLLFNGWCFYSYIMTACETGDGLCFEKIPQNKNYSHATS